MNGSPELMDIVLGTPRQQGNVNIQFGPERSGEVVLENGSLEIIHQGDAGSGPWSFALEKGLYMLREVNSNQLLPFTVRVVEEVYDVTF